MRLQPLRKDAAPAQPADRTSIRSGLITAPSFDCLMRADCVVLSDVDLKERPAVSLYALNWNQQRSHVSLSFFLSFFLLIFFGREEGGGEGLPELMAAR